MCSLKEDRVKCVEIHKDSHLPKKGWIQACVWCSSLTSKLKFYKKVETSHRDYILFLYYCKDCEKFKILENKDYVDKINTFICNEYLISC